MNLQIGISQIQNNILVNQNLNVILNCISKHQAAKSDLVLFPECSLTGFTSLVKNTDFAEVYAGLQKIQSLVNAGITSAFVPTVMPSSEGSLINSGFYFRPNQERLSITKEGLTESEQKFFIPGTNQRRQFDIKGYKVAFLFCIEAAHEPWRYLHEHDKPDLILWPAYWGRDEIPAWNENLKEDALKVYQNNKVWRVPILCSTYFENHENIGLTHGPFGQSLVVSQNNELLYSAKKSAADDYIINFQRDHSGVATILNVHPLI